jgi:hypothetical protein
MAVPFVFNIAKGKVAEYAARVNANDPTNAAFIVLVLATAGLESDAVLEDKNDITDLVSGTTNEVTNAGYARKAIDQAGGITITVDDTNDRVDVDMPDQTFAAIAAGDGWSRIVIAYDSDTTAGTDANIVPLLCMAFVVTPDGSDIIAQFNASGIFRAEIA